jgi:hypothetical protein
METMDFVVFAQNHMVPSDECRGSMAVTYVPQLVQLHAVARKDDGTLHARTACDRLPVWFPPEQVEHMPWKNTNSTMRCLECAQATGYLAINDVTGEVVPGRRN